MSFPANLKYTKDHEWVSIEGNVATIGITAFAQDQLGDIVYIDINSTGKAMAAEEVFGTVEAVKFGVEIIAHVSAAPCIGRSARDAPCGSARA